MSEIVVGVQQICDQSGFCLVRILPPKSTTTASNTVAHDDVAMVVPVVPPSQPSPDVVQATPIESTDPVHTTSEHPRKKLRSGFKPSSRK